MKNHTRISFIIVLISIMKSTSVYISNMSIPTSYVLNEKNFCQPLVLDCVYEFGQRDVGFVLKWYHNRKLIYQWIPPKRPYFFSSVRYGFNPIFVISNDEKQKYRALQLLPSRNLSGDWMCSVASYYEHDRRIQKMQIIVPEQSFRLEVREVKIHTPDANITEIVVISCRVNMISPEPNLRIIIGDIDGLHYDVEMGKSYDNFVNKSILSRVLKTSIPSPSLVTCVLDINGTSYVRKKQIVYYEKNKRISAKMMFQSFMNSIIPNGSLSSLKSQFSFWFVTVIIINILNLHNNNHF